MQAYSDPTRDDDYALPDVETFQRLWCAECPACGEAGTVEDETITRCARCDARLYPEDLGDRLDGKGTPYLWFWWSCFPGCLPDGEPLGPFDTEADALADAQDND